jgi:endonuclease I
MLYDNDWIIDMLEKKLQIDPEDVVPEFIFDKGYACWQEMYPGEQKDIKEDREKIIELLQQDRNVYLLAMQNWNIERIERLKSAGWRKVQQA